MQWIFGNPWVMPLGTGGGCANVCIFLTIDTLESYIMVRNPLLQGAVADLVRHIAARALTPHHEPSGISMLWRKHAPAHQSKLPCTGLLG